MSLRNTAILITLVFASCKGSNEVTSNKSTDTPERKKLACAQTHVEMHTPHLDWFEESSNVLSKSTEILVLPKAYKVYSTDPLKANAFFTAIEKRETLSTVLPLPKPAECQLFKVENNLKEGARIPPGIVMTLGTAQEQKAAISYNKNNKQLIAHINWFGLLYEILPVNIDNTTYYVVYEKQKPKEKIEDKKTNNEHLKLVEYKPVK